MRKRKNKNILLVVIIVALGAFGVMFMANNDRAQHELLSGGALELTMLEKGADVFIDDVKATVAVDRLKPFGYRYTIVNIPEGVHSVIVNKDDHWPWFKDVIISEGETTKHNIMIAPKEPEVESIPQYTGKGNEVDFSPEYIQAASLFSATYSSGGVNVHNGNIAVRKEGGNIIASWTGAPDEVPSFFCDTEECKTTLNVFSGVTPIKEVYFYPGADNIFVFSAGDSIYAIEANKSSNQNFQPLYSGVDPRIVAPDERSIRIKDGETILNMEL